MKPPPPELRPVVRNLDTGVNRKWNLSGSQEFAESEARTQVEIVEELMLRSITGFMAIVLLSLGLAACDDEVEIETPEGEVEIEED